MLFRFNRHSGYYEAAWREFVISGASVITQAAYYEAILKVPGISLYSALTVFDFKFIYYLFYLLEEDRPSWTHYVSENASFLNDVIF